MAKKAMNAAQGRYFDALTVYTYYEFHWSPTKAGHTHLYVSAMKQLFNWVLKSEWVLQRLNLRYVFVYVCVSLFVFHLFALLKGLERPLLQYLETHFSVQWVCAIVVDNKPYITDFGRITCLLNFVLDLAFGEPF